jgi:uncharacterized membrane protein
MVKKQDPTKNVSLPTESDRLPGLDTLRGFAVLLMLIYHFVYNLVQFKFLTLNLRSGFWWGLPRFIVFIFLFCVGISLQLTHGKNVRIRSFFKRLGKLTLAALLVSLATYGMFPQAWIFFGTLHCIATISLLCLPVLIGQHDFQALPLVLSLFIWVLQFGFDYGIGWVGQLFPAPTLDFIPFYPWIAVTFFGIYITPWVSPSLKLKGPIGGLINKYLSPVLNPLGQWAFPIYLIHQPLFWGGTWLVYTYFR